MTTVDPPGGRIPSGDVAIAAIGSKSGTDTGEPSGERGTERAGGRTKLVRSTDTGKRALRESEEPSVRGDPPRSSTARVVQVMHGPVKSDTSLPKFLKFPYRS